MLDTSDIIHDEQNGFRKSKSTIDHLSTLKSIIETIYSQVECAIELNGNMTEWFNVNAGLKQACVLSPVLFKNLLFKK